MNCGTQLSDSANFCNKCGTQQESAASTSASSKGKVEFAGGEYDGDLVNGVPHGRGKVTWPGTMFSPGVSFYEGEFANGKVEEGDWKNGEFAGGSAAPLNDSSSAKKFCGKCGHKLNESTKFCGGCGEKVGG